ncbi:MAG: thioredoxin family protein [Planctomycetaceae bacterium]|nr:thioredoxin family protein [Planctomycetaceae bacterium]
MTSLTLAIAMQLTLFGADPKDDGSYAKAHEITTKTGQPMVVLVGAKWCPACVQMKESVVPQLKKNGTLKNIAFAEVDLDQERELGQQLIKGGPIPQLLMFRQTKLGWRLRRIIGGQSVDKVDRFIAEGVALDKAAKVQEASSSTRPEQSQVGDSQSKSD